MSHLELLPCRWRRPSKIVGRQECLSPIVRAGPYGVMDHQCWMCPERDHLDQAAPATAVERCGAVRHLLYHIYPVRDRWQWHMEKLRAHLSLFNGRRLVSVAVGPNSASAHEVARYFLGLDVDVLSVRNDPELKEVASYPQLVGALSPYTAGQDVHFYAHAKGVVTEDMGPACRRWSEAMYEALLDHWPAVRRELVTHGCVGIFRRLWRGPVHTRAKWHYSGAFRWVRHADFYSRDWSTIDATWLGAETHPGLVFGVGESSCLYGEFATQDIGLYAEPEWERWAEPRRQEWLAAHVDDRQTPLLLTVILTAHRQPDLVHEAVASVQAQTADAWQLLIVDSGWIAAKGAYDRYQGDARISVMLTGETADHPSHVGRQAWAINEAWRRGRVRGDLVVHLCDDDTLAPTWVESCLAYAREHPDQHAWYGAAEREALLPSGQAQRLPRIETCGVGSPTNSLRCRVDGMQVCHRRSVHVEWPEDPASRRWADGYWMEALAQRALIEPVDCVVGRHRHTPNSTFTRSAP